MSEHIKVEKFEGILTLVMARPEKKNALTDAMYKALADALEASNEDHDTRVILIKAEGDMFTAGNDLGEFAATNASGSGPRNVSRFIRAISTASKPVVAAVQGRAVGVGTTMLLHCDQVILAENVQLTTPFVGLALVPEAASSLLLTAQDRSCPRVLDVRARGGCRRSGRPGLGPCEPGGRSGSARRREHGNRPPPR